MITYSELRNRLFTLRGQVKEVEDQMASAECTVTLTGDEWRRVEKHIHAAHIRTTDFRTASGISSLRDKLAEQVGLTK